MQASMPANVEALPSAQAAPSVDYATALDKLLHLYTGIDKAAVALPFVSGSPGRQDRSLTRWKWQMGEIGTPFIFLRPVALGFLHWHFRNRLLTLRQHVLLETQFSEDREKATLAKIDRATDFWKQRATVGSILFSWIIPLGGPVIAVWKWLFPNAFWVPPSWFVPWAALSSLLWALLVLRTAFAAKRGLMLGGRDHTVYRPYNLSGAGGYAQEREILGPLGLAKSEFPIDAMLFMGWGFLYTIVIHSNTFWGGQLDLSQSWALNIVRFISIETLLMVLVTWFIVSLALRCREKLGRA